MKTILTLILISFTFFCKAQESLKVELQYVHFDATDTTLAFEIHFEVDTVGVHFEEFRQSRDFSLKKASDRDSLRNNPLVEPVLQKMGVFLSNQFPEE